MREVIAELAELYMEKEITRRQFIRATAALGLSLSSIQTLLTACASEATATPSPTNTPAPTATSGATPTPAPPTPTPTPSMGTGSLTVGFPGSPNSLDPYFWVNFREEDQVHLIFDSLLYREPTGEYRPSLALSYDRLDPNTWQFKLREGIKFDNGEPFNAEAVKYSWERSIDPDLACTLYSPKVIELQGGEIVDDYTINMKTGKVVAETQLWWRLNDWAILPPGYYGELSPEEAAKKPMGSGPFRLVDWVVDDFVTEEAKPDYWGNDLIWGGPPKFKTLTYKTIPEATGRVAALERGDVDLVHSIPMDQLRMLGGELKPIVAPTNSRLFIGINQSKPYLNDVRVRQALNYAVNWEPINQTIYMGQAPRMSSWVCPDSVNFNPKLEPYPYDPDKAKELLAEAGVPEGHSVTLQVSAKYGSERPLIAQAIAVDLSNVGLNVTVELIDQTILVKELTAKEPPDLWCIGYGGGNDDGVGALTTLQKDFVLSAYFWEAPEWEELFAALGTEEYALDTEKYKKAIHDLQEMAVEDPPVIYLTIEPRGYAIGPRVKAWEPRRDLWFVPWEVTLA